MNHELSDKINKQLKEKVVDTLKVLSDNELGAGSNVATILRAPDALDFYRKWVAPNVPVVVRGGVRHWLAMDKWNPEYLSSKLKEKKIEVAVTPTGYADAITTTVSNGETVKCFVLPHEETMTLDMFFHKLDNLNSSDVLYIQRQNSNLTQDFPELLDDIEDNIPWATESFGKSPEAVNIWIGDGRAVSSLHKDPFENIYCVVSGWKDFVLYAPTNRPWLPYKTVPIGKYVRNVDGKFKIELTKDTVPWIDFDPCNPNFEKYPRMRFAKPLRVRIEKGDILYLPSLWYHHVQQSHKCIAVNFWYDMEFDVKYLYLELVEKLTELIS